MIQQLIIPISKNIRVSVVTRPQDDLGAKDHTSLQNTLSLLIVNGVNVIFKSNIHQKFAIIDQKIVLWYGSKFL
ncbi:MAG: hypothetical protein J7M09_04165 [Deltaproteobacteria bacterium]|nr:hypothetical protein [Candidatus Tharpella sp.]